MIFTIGGKGKRPTTFQTEIPSVFGPRRGKRGERELGCSLGEGKRKQIILRSGKGGRFGPQTSVGKEVSRRRHLPLSHPVRG